MTLSPRKLTLAVLTASVATSMIAVDTAEAFFTKRQRNRDGIMRLGGPANGAGNGASAAIVDRTGAPSFISAANVRAFSLQRFERGGL